MIKNFKPLEKLVSDISTIKKAQDLLIFLPGFAEDGMSDLLTNILHELLNEFTIQQMQLYDIKSNAEIEFYSWDCSQWKFLKKPGYVVDEKELLLIPKNIVRKKYLFGVEQYFRRIIIERIRNDGGFTDDNNKPIPKDEIIKSMQNSKKNWKYDEVIKHSIQHNDALEEYHYKLPSFYSEKGRIMEDEDLDKTVYGCITSKNT